MRSFSTISAPKNSSTSACREEGLQSTKPNSPCRKSYGFRTFRITEHQLCITHLESYQNHSLPTDSTDEALIMTVVSTHPLNVHRFARLTRAIFAVGVWFLSPVSPAQSPGVTTDVPAAIAALGDPDSLVRLAAVDLLSREKGQAVNLALQTALHDKNRTVRATAAVALYKRGFDFDLDVIRKDLFDSDPVTQANAAKALCDMGRTVPDDLISSLTAVQISQIRERALLKTQDITPPPRPF